MFVATLKHSYDAIVIGSGFGSLFAVEAYRRRFPRSRIAMIERGNYKSQAWQIQNKRNSAFDISQAHKLRANEKVWNYTIGFGGGLNCWWAQTPRFHPADFKTKSLYGKAIDWPIDYPTLEPYYDAAEQRMGIAGDDSISKVLPRSRAFPQPPHRMTTIDRIMQAAQPDAHFAIATARSSIGDKTRARCCSTARCDVCPTNAKFTTDNAFLYLAHDPDVEILLNAEARLLEHENGVVRGVVYLKDGAQRQVNADLVVLGANGIHSPAILLRSGIDDYWVGRGLHEQHSLLCEAYLDGLDNFDGGTVTTGLNYSLYDGPFRSTHAGALVYFENRWSFGLRPEVGKWRRILPLWISIEDLPDPEHRVVLDDDLPLIMHPRVSDYAKAGAAAVQDKLPHVLAPLPVEKIAYRGVANTASHIQGTLRMGASSADSVVDKGLLHHKLRNLMIVGSSVIPTSSCANPSLTTAALSLLAVDRL